MANLSRRGVPGGERIFRRKDGRYCCAVTVAPRVLTWLYGKTRAEVIDKREVLLKELRDGLLPGRRVTLGQYLEDWLEERVRTRKRKATYDLYRLKVGRMVLGLGKVLLADLSPLHIRRWMDQVASDSSPNYANECRTTLGTALDDAKDEGFVARNVVRLVDPLNVDKMPSSKVLSVEDLLKFLRAAASHRLGPLFLLAAATGMRISEILGMRWNDLDTRNGTLSVQRQLQWQDGGLWEMAPTKSKSGVRTITIGPTVLHTLVSLRSSQLEERATFGGNDHGLIFCREDGKPYYLQYLRETMHRLAAGVGVGHFRFHDLRHTYVDLTRRRIDIKAVSEMLGHASISITLGMYGHSSARDRVDAAQVIEDAFCDVWSKCGQLSEEHSDDDKAS